MSTEAQAPAAEPAGESDSQAAEMAGVFGLDTAFLTGGEPAPGSTEALASEPAAGVAAPSPAAEPSPAPVAPPAPVVEPAPAQPLADANASPVAAPVVDPAAPPRTPEDQALYVRSLEAQVAALKATPPAQPQAPAPSGSSSAPGTAPTEETPAYALSIPTDVTAAIFGEDQSTAVSGLTHLINSLAKVIHQKVVSDINPRIQAVRSEYAEAGAMAQRQAEAKQYQDAYYGKFPTHNTPVLLPIIQEQAGLLAAQFPGVPVDDNWYNALGSRVNAAIGAASAAAGIVPAAPAPTPAPAAPKPAGMLPAAAPRAAALIPGTEGSDELNGVDNIMSTFSG